MSVLPRRGLAIRGTVAMTAMMLAGGMAGCASESEPVEWPDDPSAPALPELPSVSADPAEAEAIDEILAAHRGFREVEADLYADPPSPNIVRREFSPYLGDPMLSEIVGTLNEMRNAGIAFDGQPVSEPTIVELELDATPPTATVRDCVDATNWLSVFQETGEPVPGDALPSQFVMELEATVYPEHGWLFHNFAIQEETPC
jgi:hypothetical protein